MRLDAAKLKGCFGSWFLRRACYPVKQSANSARPERTRPARRVFSFLGSTLQLIMRLDLVVVIKIPI